MFSFDSEMHDGLDLHNVYNINVIKNKSSDIDTKTV